MTDSINTRLPLKSCSAIDRVETSLGCGEKTDTRKFAELIHKNVNLSDSKEKQRWREYKATAMNFSTMVDMKGVISPEMYDLIDRMYFEEEHKVLLGKVHQTKEFNKDTHYTFIHGQALTYWVINQFLKELEKLKHPDKDLSLYHFLRLPEQELKTTRQAHIDRSKNNARYDYRLGNELLSVDGDFFNDYPTESTNYFVKNNDNIITNNQREIIRGILEKYSVDNAKNLKIIQDLCSQFNALGSIGHIYAISIPKEKFSEYVYTAHNYGVACKCVEDKDQLQRIDDLQKHIKIQKCNHDHIPQYRILTHFLNPEEISITLHTSISKAQKTEFKDKIRALAEELHFQGEA